MAASSQPSSREITAGWSGRTLRRRWWVMHFRSGDHGEARRRPPASGVAAGGEQQMAEWLTPTWLEKPWGWRRFLGARYCSPHETRRVADVLRQQRGRQALHALRSQVAKWAAGAVVSRLSATRWAASSRCCIPVRAR